MQPDNIINRVCQLRENDNFLIWNLYQVFILIVSRIIYRDEIYSLQNLLSRNQAGPGRTVKKEQEEISPNHVQRLNLISVQHGATTICSTGN